ncbi:exonuclease 3'-5' domain-containing protein 2-like [Contarinia nasturtii]|uniref:exonuclease 3'-5' domain-containing protein 2-like n=1 Tax=Contarinia nasturtii TaxID=265458 RepID=UPI0012D48400|nr:exonuclease 3'-5' domain-containing protein 2-like [Contarinia nasturtii]XP_031622523.1 exonuclease 3'-5' domain-containing protein 2-like [Contarinia nasturtii]
MSSIGKGDDDLSTKIQCDSQTPFKYTNPYCHRPNEYRPETITPAQNLLADHTVLLVNTYKECREAVIELNSQLKEYDVLGIDAEWKITWRKKSGRKPVALLQLASQYGLCILIRLCIIERIPAELDEILANPKILKVGIESRSDGVFLNKDYQMRVWSTLDLRYMAAMCGLRPGGLAAMAKDHLFYELSKNKRVQCSNWELEILSQRQIEYAALDAIIGYKLFLYYSSFQHCITYYTISCFYDKHFSHPKGMIMYEKSLSDQKTEQKQNE